MNGKSQGNKDGDGFLPGYSEEEKPFREAVPSIFLILTVFTLNFLNRSILAPLLIPVEESFGITHGPAARIFFYVSCGYSITILVSGFLSSQFAHRGTILVSSGFMATAILMMAAARNIQVMYASAILLGSGAGLYPPSGLSILISLVQKKDRQKALAFHETGSHVGMVAAPLFANLMLMFTSWRGTMVVSALITIAVGINFYFRTGFVKMRGQAPTFSAFIPLLKDRRFWILMLFFGMVIGSVQGVYLLVPAFLATEGGFTLKTANNIFGISRFIPIIFLISAGFFLDKLGPYRSLKILLALSGIAVLLMGLLKGPFLIAVVFIQPALGALFFPAGIAVLSEIGPPESRNVALSLMLPPAIMFGIGIIPAFLGFMGDKASFSLGFILLGALITGSVSVSRYLK